MRRQLRKEKLRNGHMAIPVLVAILVVIFAGCKKEVETFTCECQELPQYPESIFGWSYVNQGPSFTRPSFDPLDDDQFSYVMTDAELQVMQIRTHRLSTNLSETIFEGNIRSTPQWGANGWLVFAREDNNIWKLRQDGDSLTQLTFTGDCFSPKWNTTSSLILYDRGFSQQVGILSNANGFVNDTIYHGGVDEISSWNHPIYVGVVANTANYYNPFDSLSHEFIDIPDSDSNKYGTVWVGDDLVYSYEKGIYRVNLNSGETTMTKESCNAVQYSRPTLNHSGTKLLWHRVDSELVDPSTISTKTRIVQMNIDGTDEEFIDLE